MICEDLLKDKKVLLVEDEATTLLIMSSWLKKIAGTVYTATNGAEGIESVREHNPDIIITDLEMPVMNGIEMIEILKKEKSNMPIVVVTAFNDEAHKAPKADAVLTKPIIKDELKNTIEKIFCCC